MTIRAFRATMGTSKSLTVSSSQSFVSDINAQVQECIENYENWVDNIDEQAPNILQEALEPTFEMSQEIVPVDTGDLKESGYLVTEHVKGNTQVEMGYGRGGNPDYAIPVHEDMDVHHKAPTQAKYLQHPLEQDGDNIQARIINGFEVASGFGGGF